jgi:hypothetical protein
MNDPDYKGYLTILSGVVVAGAVGIVALNWLVDPLQFDRRAAYPPLLIGEKDFKHRAWRRITTTTRL